MIKILAVDDSSDWRNAHKTLLNEIFGENLSLTIADRAYDGLCKYNNAEFDLVITDLQMESDFEPMYAGEWLTKEIKEQNANQKILIVSSCYNIDKIAQEYNVHYLSKRNIVFDKDSYKTIIKNII